MFKLIRAFFSMIAGFFSSKEEALQANKHVMTATYDRAIDKKRERFSTVKNAVAELIRLEEMGKIKLKELGDKCEKLEKVKAGALAAMQRTISNLKGMTKEQIQQNPDFIKHNAAYNDASSTLAEVESQIADKEAEIAERAKMVSQYKAELQQMQRDADKLVSEKAEAIADVAIAQESEAINAVLAGIESDTTDQDLAKARAARHRAKAKASITAQLAGNDARAAEDEYVALANTTRVDAQLDNLLNWGETEDPTTLADAKLPE